MIELVIPGSLALVTVGAGLFGWQLWRRDMHRWLPTYVRETTRRGDPAPGQDVHALICFADHYEPKAGRADVATGRRRVATWVEEYPRQLGHFRDTDGRPPRYTFFFPAEEYEPEYLDALAGLCRQGYGEVEVHLHHQNDTPDGFRKKIMEFRDILVRDHGLLGRDRDTGETVYGFIHGNWALCNSQPDGSWCGVDNELDLLRQTGCYADFTFPSAPDPTQPPIINRLYYAWDQPGRPRSQDTGLPVGAGAPPDNALLMVQGPLLLDWRRRKRGLIPGTENACLQDSQPPDITRLASWLRARVQVPARPDWYFIKLHAHGAPEDAHDALLGPPMVRFHEALARRAQEDPHFHYHYVTAREMANLVLAAEAGYRGPVDGARDYRYVSNVKGEPPVERVGQLSPAERGV